MTGLMRLAGAAHGLERQVCTALGADWDGLAAIPAQLMTKADGGPLHPPPPDDCPRCVEKTTRLEDIEDHLAAAEVRQ